MSSQPLLIDNIAFAKRGEHLAGTLSLADCPRLAELLASQAPADSSATGHKDDLQGSSINFTLDGETNAAGQHFLHLALSGTLITYCQRCLEQMPFKLDLDFNYLVSNANIDNADAAGLEDSDDYDLQEASQNMDLLALIEDEVIMATPIAPLHAGNCAHGAMQSGEKPNPFAALKGLIKS
ncbi:YceD family protein [Methylotenera sp. G11]|uniref:YceD family protein n=1 Tax=Methylotenera sp. G11 TaxID=1506585 RepID=UPI0006464C66|nr:YceD family protein [Methylotenera sp. G11]